MPAGRIDTIRLLERLAEVPGLTHVDLNYPDHVVGVERGLQSNVESLGLKINGLAMRYGSNPEFILGAFSNPSARARREAIDFTKKGVDAARAAGTDLMTIWLGQDGFDYSFQVDYTFMWNQVVEAIREVATHDPECKISIEYKPNEPRAFSILPDLSTTLLAISEASSPNLGVTLDFAHMLYAGEQPAASVALAAAKTNVLGVHVNDGYSKRDDGLMVGSVHVQATVEFFLQLLKCSYDGVVYFDTFPDASGLDSVSECSANIETTRKLIAVAQRMADSEEFRSAISRQDPITTNRILFEALSSG